MNGDKKDDMRIAIVDDSISDHNTLTTLLPDCLSELGFQVTCLDCYLSGDDFLNTFQSGQYDIVFLDIYMNGSNGIETAQSIRRTDMTTKIIFITTSNDFAAESYSVRADYYFLKPYTRDQLLHVLDTIHLQGVEQQRLLYLPDQSSVPLHSICYTYYHGHYETLCLTDKSEKRIRISHAAFTELLQPFFYFISCNKGMIVNMEHVQALKPYTFLLPDNIYIPISRRRYPSIQTAYSNFLITTTCERT